MTLRAAAGPLSMVTTATLSARSVAPSVAAPLALPPAPVQVRL